MEKGIISCNQMNYLLIIIMLCLFPFFSYGDTLASSSNDQPKQLFLYNWSDYMDPTILEDFYKEFGVKINEVFYETDSLKDKLLITTGGQGMDLIIGSGASMRGYIEPGYISRLDPRQLDQLKYLDPQWYQRFPELRNEAVPMLWGSLGISYRQDKIPYPITSWNQMFKPERHLKKRILMIDDPRDLLGMALKAQGVSVNSSSEADLNHASKLLYEQRKYVKSYGYVKLGQQSELVTGDIWMAMTYNGDGLALSAIDPNIKYVVPKEGTNLWVDFIAVLGASKHKQEAMAFINFLHRPEIAAKLTAFTLYASTNEAAKAFFDESILENPAIYLSPEMIKNSEVYTPQKPRGLMLRNRVLDTLKIHKGDAL